MNSIVLVVTSKPFELNTSVGYMIGAVIALFLFGYLIYALVKPEKF